MAASTVRAVQACILAASVGLSGAGTAAPGLPPVEQKWGWGDFDALKDQVTQGLKEKTDELTKVVSSYKESTMEFANALKDGAFKNAVQASGICEKLRSVEEKTGEEIEDEMPELMADSESTSPETVDCTAVATELTVENMKERLSSDTVNDITNKFLELVTSRSSAALCEGKNGMKHWLESNAHLQAKDPEEYKKQLKKQITDQMGSTLERFTKQFCGPALLRRFDAGPRAFLGLGAGGTARAATLPTVAFALVGLGALAARRATRRGALELQPSVPEALLERGAQE